MKCQQTKTAVLIFNRQTLCPRKCNHTYLECLLSILYIEFVVKKCYLRLRINTLLAVK